MLSVDETKILDLPNLWPDKFYHSNLIKIGTIGEGSCFFHSVFRSTNKRDYQSLSIPDRKEMIRGERKHLSELSKDFYINTMNSVIDTSQKLSDFFKKLYSFFNGPKIVLKREYKNNLVLTKLLKVSSHSLENCLPSSYSSFDKNVLEKPELFNSSNIDEYQKNFYQLMKNGANSSMCQELIEELVKMINKKIKGVNVENFKNMVENPKEYVSDEFIKFLSDYYNLDIYFIDILKKTIYMAHEDLLKGNRPSIIIGVIQDQDQDQHNNLEHFESVGLREKGKKEIITLFDPDHPLITRLYSLIKEKKPRGEIKEEEDDEDEDDKDEEEDEDDEDEEEEEKTFIELYKKLMPMINKHPEEYKENNKRLKRLVDRAYKELLIHKYS